MAEFTSKTRCEVAESLGKYAADRHLRRSAVEELRGLSRSLIYDLMAKRHFPRPVRLTAKAVAWPEGTIVAWLASRTST